MQTTNVRRKDAQNVINLSERTTYRFPAKSAEDQGAAKNMPRTRTYGNVGNAEETKQKGSLTQQDLSKTKTQTTSARTHGRRTSHLHQKRHTIQSGAKENEQLRT